MSKHMVALDCGNSSYRIVLGKYENGKIESEVIRQIPNGTVKRDGYYYWDIKGIFEGFLEGLAELVKRKIRIDSIGICTWGVDFALFDQKGSMIQDPLCYRNQIGEEILEKLSAEEKRELFYHTGILCDKINSVYMLKGMQKYFPEVMKKAEKYLMIPDIINYFLTGVMIHEPTELSTSQMMDSESEKINPEVCKKFGISEHLFSAVGSHGKKIGMVKKELLKQIGADYEIPVICVPSHDTASAVAAIPAGEHHFGFISCGTWSLIGAELDAPVKRDEVIKANLTNEMGAFGKITLLKNNAGMFIVNCLKKEYEAAQGRKVSWEKITEMAEEAKEGLVMDLNDMAFFNPSDMSQAVWDYLMEKEQVSGEKDWGQIFRAFYESLAFSYAATIRDIETVVGRTFEKIYMVGGGTASRLLLKLTADYTGKTIITCYGESTSMGNLAVQLKYFYPELDLIKLREIVSKSYRTARTEAGTRRGGK